jgi:hypothetical protein
VVELGEAAAAGFADKLLRLPDGPQESGVRSPGTPSGWYQESGVRGQESAAVEIAAAKPAPQVGGASKRKVKRSVQ